jgi:hypothetical protein
MRVSSNVAVVQIENDFASGRQKRTRGPRPTLVSLKRSCGGDSISDPVIWSSVSGRLETQAVGYYLHNHVDALENVPDIVKGVSGTLVPSWIMKTSNPMLELGLSALALAIFSRTHGHPDGARASLLKYQQLLRLTQKNLFTIDEHNIDFYLLTAFFMSRFETTGERPHALTQDVPFARTNNCFRHHDGALAMLKVWKFGLSNDRRATDIIKHTRRATIKSALLRCISLPKWLQDGSEFGERGWELEYDVIVVRLAALRQQALALHQSHGRISQHLFSEEVGKLDQEGEQLDVALKQWKRHFGSWHYESYSLPKQEQDHYPNADFYSPIVFHYSSMRSAATWIHYFVTSILIASARLKILQGKQLVEDHSEWEKKSARARCRSDLEAVTVKFLGSIPYFLQRCIIIPSTGVSASEGARIEVSKEEIKVSQANLMFWQVSIVSTLSALCPEQNLWSRTLLSRLGKLTGYAAFETAQNDSWVNF